MQQIKIEFNSSQTYLGIEADIQQALLDKHFLRKHDKNAYYGQK